MLMRLFFYFITPVLIYLHPLYAYSNEISATTISTWPPFMFEENGKITGIATEIVESIFEEVAIDYKIYVYPWARAYQQVKTSNKDMIYMLYRTPERESLFNWVGPIVPAHNMYFYKLSERKDIVINSLDDAKKYKVGVVRNVANHKFLLSKGFDDGVHLDPVVAPQQNVKKLFMGRIDLLIGNEYTLPTLLKEANITYGSIERIYSVLESEPGYMGFSLDTPDELVDKIQHAFEKVQSKGTIDLINAKYIDKM